LFAAAYLGSYNPSNLCANYLGDLGNNLTFGSFSFSVSAATNFDIVVNEIPTEAGGCDYTLVVIGTECPPTLNIAPVPSDKVRLFWPTSAGGYALEATPSVSPTNWAAVTDQPIVGGENFNVTNPATGTNKFYRLHKP
jgi:hypothetical protein